MAKKVTLKDKDDVTLYPHTSVTAVYDVNGDPMSDFEVINDLVTGGTSKALSAEQGKKLNTRVDGLYGTEDKEISLTSYIANAHNGNISFSSGKWGNFTSNNQHIIVPVQAGRTYMLLAKDTGTLSLRYACLYDYSFPHSASTPDYCEGWTKPLLSPIGVPVELIAPEDCKYLYFEYINNTSTVALEVILRGMSSILKDIEGQIEAVDGHVSSVESDVNAISDVIDLIEGTEDSAVDLTASIADARNGIISFTNGQWANKVSTHQHIIVPALPNRKYDLLAKDIGMLSLRYAFFTETPTNYNTTPPYCSGYSLPSVKAKGIVETVTTPADCNYFYFEYINNNNTADLSVTLKGIKGQIDELQEDVDVIRASGFDTWSGKKVAWYGTSIPAGSNFRIPIKANAIDAYITSYKVEKTSITAEDNLPCEYPVIAASLLGASTVHNESVGSSRIAKNTTDSRLLIRCKALCNTVQEICSYIWGSYNIDIANQTFEENHENTIGITTFLTTAGTWVSFVNNVMICLSQSYQIKLTLRHLISDATQRSAYVHDVFGEYYDRFVAMLTSVNYTLADLVGYNEVDLFVLEHSVNDSNPSMDYPVTSDDVTTFQGAYNKIIGEILRYKPSVRIAIVSNYGPDSSEITYNKDKTAKLKEIAEHWQIAFCEMRKYINVSATKQMTQGYWEQNANVWHDSGFQWSEDAGNDAFTTNAYFHPDLYSSSLVAIKQNINPQQIHGVWYWEAPARYIWMRDAVHPHSDNGGRLCIIIAKTLAKWLLTIPPLS
jgi:copper chaperone CopZ